MNNEDYIKELLPEIEGWQREIIAGLFDERDARIAELRRELSAAACNLPLDSTAYQRASTFLNNGENAGDVARGANGSPSPADEKP